MSYSNSDVRARVLREQFVLLLSPAVDCNSPYAKVMVNHLVARAMADSCDHSQYSFVKHGRVCSCGAMITDFGD